MSSLFPFILICIEQYGAYVQSGCIQVTFTVMQILLDEFKFRVPARSDVIVHAGAHFTVISSIYIQCLFPEAGFYDLSVPVYDRHSFVEEPFCQLCNIMLIENFGCIL